MAGKRKPKALKGGLNDAPVTPEGAVSELTGRYEYSKLPLQEKLRKRMQVKQEDSRRQIAEALLAAAYQHRTQPDPVSNLYGRQFQSLTQSEKSSLLSALDPNEAAVVSEAFGGNVIVDQPAQPTRLGEAEPDTAESRARAAARRVMEEMGASTVPSVDLNKYTLSEGSGKTPLPMQAGDTVTYVDAPGADWTKGQRTRGYRKILYTPEQPGRAPRSVIEVLSDRKEEFSTRDEKPKKTRNPNYGKPKDFVRVTPQTEFPDVDRLTPSSFNALSPEAQKAAAQGSEIMEFIRQAEETYDGDFLASAEGQRLRAKLSELATAHPEAVEFMNNSDVAIRPMPTDDVPTSPDAERVPFNSTLSFRVGDPALRSRMETRADRRYQGDVPADAPNRMGWQQVADIEANEGTAFLPYPDETERLRKQKDLDYKGRREQRQSDDQIAYNREQIEAKEQKRLAAEGDTLPDDEEAIAAMQEFVDEDVFSDSEDATPVQDISGSQSPDAAPGSYLVTYGTATGSPSQVKRDRDFALREGRSYREKMQEKLFRMANEFTSADMADASSGARVGDDLDKNAVIKQSRTGYQNRTLTGKPLRLDGLVPQWRALMYFQEGDQIVIRRPRADEIASELAYQAGLPRQVVTGLIPHVQRAMDTFEGVAPDPKYKKATRLYGQIVQPNTQAMQRMEKQALSFRMPGDTRPLISDQSQQMLSTPRLQPARALPEAPAAVESAPPTENPFSALVRKARGGGGTTNSIMALLSALGAGTQMAEGGEQPGVEYLAMAGRRGTRTVQGVINSNPAPSPPLVPARQAAQAAPAPQAANPAVNAAWTPPITDAQSQDLRNLFNVGAAAQQTTPAPTATAPAPTPTPPKTMAGKAASGINSYFGSDPVYNLTTGAGGLLGKGLYNVGRFGPTIATVGAAAPFVIPPIVRAYRSMSQEISGQQPAAPAAPAAQPAPAAPTPVAPTRDFDAEMRDAIFGPAQPADNDSTMNIGKLRQMLAQR